MTKYAPVFIVSSLLVSAVGCGSSNLGTTEYSSTCAALECTDSDAGSSADDCDACPAGYACGDSEDTDATATCTPIPEESDCGPCGDCYVGCTSVCGSDPHGCLLSCVRDCRSCCSGS